MYIVIIIDAVVTAILAIVIKVCCLLFQLHCNDNVIAIYVIAAVETT